MLSEAEKIAFKEAVKKACTTLLLERIKNVSQAMERAQESANNQEKSSVGDKHETSRAIGQAESEMNGRQLLQARTDLKFLESITVDQPFESVAIGSVVELNGLLFFVALGLGSLTVTDKTVMAISHLSPLFAGLKRKKVGDKVMFQSKETLIKDVY